MPVQKVGSAVICLTPHKKPPYDVKDESLLFSLIRASFNQRKKTLVNGIYNYEGLSFSKDLILEALTASGLARIGGESLSLEQFINIANYLSEKS